jgi:hypothetical protein
MPWMRLKATTGAVGARTVGDQAALDLGGRVVIPPAADPASQDLSVPAGMAQASGSR